MNPRDVPQSFCARKPSVFVEERDIYFQDEAADALYRTGEMLYNSIPTNSPKTSILKDTLEEFWNIINKTEFEIVVFIAFAAIRSILQRQPYTKITNEYLIGRMAGNSKAGEPIPDRLFKYNKRHQLDKIKMEL